MRAVSRARIAVEARAGAKTRTQLCDSVRSIMHACAAGARERRESTRTRARAYLGIHLGIHFVGLFLRRARHGCVYCDSRGRVMRRYYNCL